MNIEWTVKGKPVLISKLQDLCYGITVYRCRALHGTENNPNESPKKCPSPLPTGFHIHN